MTSTEDELDRRLRAVTDEIDNRRQHRSLAVETEGVSELGRRRQRSTTLAAVAVVALVFGGTVLAVSVGLRDERVATSVPGAPLPIAPSESVSDGAPLAGYPLSRLVQPLLPNGFVVVAERRVGDEVTVTAIDPMSVQIDITVQLEGADGVTVTAHAEMSDGSDGVASPQLLPLVIYARAATVGLPLQLERLIDDEALNTIDGTTYPVAERNTGELLRAVDLTMRSTFGADGTRWGTSDDLAPRMTLTSKSGTWVSLVAYRTDGELPDGVERSSANAVVGSMTVNGWVVQIIETDPGDSGPSMSDSEMEALLETLRPTFEGWEVNTPCPTYTVLAGDTLHGIATKLDVSVEDLAESIGGMNAPLLVDDTIPLPCG